MVSRGCVNSRALRSKLYLLGSVTVLAVAPSIASAQADLSNVLGITHVDGKYYFGPQDFLDQGANEVLAAGSKVIKLEMDSQSPAKYPWNSQWPSVGSLTALAQTPYFQSVFSKPFNTYVLTTYSIGVPGGGDGTEYWLNGMTASQKTAEQQSFYNLAKYLMATYNGTGKTFLLENWEGDWALRDGNGTGLHNALPTLTNVQGMIDWVNARQAGIDQARAELGNSSNVKVYGTLEVNRVADAMNTAFNEFTVTNSVLPYTNVDFASYSSYDTQQSPTDFPKAVSYIASKLPTSALHGQNTHSVYVGEYGLPEGDVPSSTVNATINNVLNTVQADGMPYALYWQMYSNELEPTGTAPANGNNAAVRGFYMIKPDGTPSSAWHQYRLRIITSNPTRATAAAVIAGGRSAYQSAFNPAALSSTNLGPGWSTMNYAGDFNITAQNGQVRMQVVANAGDYPYALATLNVASVAGRGLSPGDYLQFTLRRENDAGIIGVEAFGSHHGSGSNSGFSPLEVWSNNAWTPFSFATDGSNPSFGWGSTTHTLGLRLDSADGTFATISYYMDGNYAGSWLYPTTATTLDSFSLFAQSNVLNSAFDFGNVQVFFASVPEPAGAGILCLGGFAILRRRRKTTL